MLIIKVDTNAVNNTTSLGNNEKLLLQKLIDAKFNTLEWLRLVEPTLVATADFCGLTPGPCVKGYTFKDFNKVNNYYTSKGQKFEQVIITRLRELGINTITTTENNLNTNILNSNSGIDDFFSPTDTASTGTGTNTGIQTPAADSSMLKNVLIVAAAIGVLFFLYRFLKPKTVAAAAA